MHDQTAQIAALQATLGFRFCEEAILREALTHASYANEDPAAVHYERLEFLGDAVLELVVSQRLFQRFPAAREGWLTQMRARLVDARSLAQRARALSLGPLVRFGRGEAQTGPERPSILADVLEAVIGAVFIDGGYEVAFRVVCRIMDPEIDALAAGDGLRDAKSRLQEAAQDRLRVQPTYELVATSGPDHDITFEARVVVGEVLTAVGRGRTKQEAEQDAAGHALSQLREE